MIVLTPKRQRQLQRAGQKLADALADRDRIIREAIAEGGSLREVGDAVGLSHPGVKKIVERGE